MYLLNVSYSKAPAAVEPHIASHGAWVKKHFEAGTILFAGPKKSGLGGVILVRQMDKAELHRILAEDSYVQADVADYQVAEFDCKLAQAEIKALVGL